MAGWTGGVDLGKAYQWRTGPRLWKRTSPPSVGQEPQRLCGEMCLECGVRGGSIRDVHAANESQLGHGHSCMLHKPRSRKIWSGVRLSCVCSFVVHLCCISGDRRALRHYELQSIGASSSSKRIGNNHTEGKSVYQYVLERRSRFLPIPVCIFCSEVRRQLLTRERACQTRLLSYNLRKISFFPPQSSAQP